MCGGVETCSPTMAIMAPAAPEQTLMGLIHSCSTGPVFVATETRIFPFENSSSSSSGTFDHHLDWHPLHSTPNSLTTIATSLESPSPSPATDWEQLLNHPSDGFELPLWSTKAAGDDFVLHESPLAKHVDDARTTALQPQQLEAVEGTKIATVTMDALVVAAAAPHENPCTTTAKVTPPRSPHRHGVEFAYTNSRKRKKDRSSSDLRGGEQGEGVDSKTGKRSSSETSGESAAGAKKENEHHRHHPRDPERNSKPEFSKQDYIHVRARRGQATDSHSLAERVRREKMSERMKFLQDLVPGCRKVTGKAVMLDEIINYVQSLQRQVESLSMKLASVSPAQSSHWTLESLLSNKEILQAQQVSSNAAAAAAFAMQQQRMPPPSPPPPAAAPQQQLPFGFNFNLRGSSSSGVLSGSRSVATLSAPTFADLTTTTTSMRPFHATAGHQFTGRDGELQSVVHMGLHQQGQLGAFANQLQCQLPMGRMKVEF